MKAVILAARDACLNIYYVPLSWRRPAGCRSLATGIWRATLPVSLASLAVAWLFTYAGQSMWVYGIMTLGLLLFSASLYGHEYAHMVIASRYGKRTALLQRGLRLGVIHSKLAPRGEVISSLGGPVTGLVSCLMVTIGMYVAQATFLALVGVCVAAFHLCSLLPWYGDGASLREALARRSRHE